MLKVSKKLPSVQRQVDALESTGFIVELGHDLKAEGTVNGTPFKGRTVVDIVDPDSGNSLGWGSSFCSLEDNFDRTEGTRVAFRRAVNDFYRTVGYKKAGEVFK